MIDFESIDAVPVERVLSQVIGGYYKQTMTDIDAAAWRAAVLVHGDAAVKRYLVIHMGRSKFAPLISDFNDFAQPQNGNAISAFEALRSQVVQCGPYRSPSFDDKAIAIAVQSLGGWAQVNEELPSPSVDRFAYDSYSKRFTQVYRAACAQVALRGAVAPTLLGLHHINAPALAIESQVSGSEFR